MKEEHLELSMLALQLKGTNPRARRREEDGTASSESKAWLDADELPRIKLPLHSTAFKKRKTEPRRIGEYMVSFFSLDSAPKGQAN
jgi:hypothetical protein